MSNRNANTRTFPCAHANRSPPSAVYAESAITTRAYVAYTDTSGQTAYLYSDCLSRSYRAVVPME